MTDVFVREKPKPRTKRGRGASEAPRPPWQPDDENVKQRMDWVMGALERAINEHQWADVAHYGVRMRELVEELTPQERVKWGMRFLTSPASGGEWGNFCWVAYATWLVMSGEYESGRD